jgi:peroxin-5
LEQREAITHLSNWLKYHPDFNHLTSKMSEQPDFDFVRDAFLEAHFLKPKDTHVALALGVLSFIKRDFAEAARFFEDGIRENPSDHTLWNKYGAAMANNQDILNALKIYHQALDLRPNYVRTMANIGLAYRSMGDY